MFEDNASIVKTPKQGDHLKMHSLEKCKQKGTDHRSYAWRYSLPCNTDDRGQFTSIYNETQYRDYLLGYFGEDNNDRIDLEIQKLKDQWKQEREAQRLDGRPSNTWAIAGFGK